VEDDLKTSSSGRMLKVKNLLIYPAIFIAAFGFFYLILNFSSMWAQVQGFFVSSKPQAEVQLGTQSTAYNAWIKGYYFSVVDEKLLDPNNDIDKDGLSNMDEFILQTNPTMADSDSDSYPDGLEVITNHNPWGAGIMSEAQSKLAATLDLSLINNRISYNTFESDHGFVSGANISNYDLNKPGVLSIPKLNLQVPLIWSKDPADFDNDLSHGVIHYPGTALPGEQGIMYVSGHSSDYIWKKDPFAQIFTRLNYLKPGDDIFIEVYGADGKTYNYRYQVTAQHTYKPDDQAQFIDYSGKTLNLSTCWPIGTQKDRLVISAKQVSL
jgi:LPXTG-site transpeptidase (sortase) family protein